MEVVGTKDMAEGFVGIQQSWLMAPSTIPKIESNSGSLSVIFGFFVFKVPTAPSEIEYARPLVYCVRNEIDHGRRCDKKEAVVNYFSAEMSEKSYLTKIFESTLEMLKRIISERIMGKQYKTYGEMGIPTSCKNVLIGVSSKCSTQPSASGNIRSPEIWHFL